MNLENYINQIQDFPKPGILFRDISPLLKNPQALDFVAERMVEKIKLSDLDYFAGVESRGFILAMLLAAKYHKGFLAIRKAGKLPPPTHRQSYSLEYGEATLEMNPGSGRIMVVDDVLATGGTLNAAIQLCQTAGYSVEEVGVLINIGGLNNFLFKDKVCPSVLLY